MSREKEKYLQAGSGVNGSLESQMFGKPCFKINGKAFSCFFDDCMVFKLEGDNHKKALGLPGAKLFDPSGKGRPMKAWVQVPYEHVDKWNQLADSACEFVRT